MKRYKKKRSPTPIDQKSDPGDEAADISGLELEDPAVKDVEGFDPYNTGVFRIDRGPWNKNTR